MPVDKQLNISNAYTCWAETYDLVHNRTRDLDKNVTQQILLGLPFSRVVELGCGTGKNTLLLTQLAATVICVDFSAGMLMKAHKKIVKDNVSFLQADLTFPWPLGDQSSDLVMSNLVLEHINDIRFIFEQAARVLAIGGHFFICELHPYRQLQGRGAVFENCSSIVSIPFFVHQISDFLISAEEHGFALRSLREWWHVYDVGKLPRLVSFVFEKK